MSLFHSSLYVSLDQFNGPLDLLLHLVQRKELSMLDVPLMKVGEGMEIPDLETGGTFVQLWATLTCLKSRALLPFEEAEEAIEMRPEEALEHLITYCQFKGPAEFLLSKEALEQAAYPRGVIPTGDKEIKGLGVEHLSLEDLQGLFEKVATKVPQRAPHIEQERWSVEDGYSWLEEGFEKEGKFLLLPFLMELPAKGALIVTFLAILEWMKQQKVSVVKDEENEIYIWKNQQHS